MVLIHLDYCEHIKENGTGTTRSKLEQLADLEDKIGRHFLRLRRSDKGWRRIERIATVRPRAAQRNRASGCTRPKKPFGDGIDGGFVGLLRCSLVPFFQTSVAWRAG
jgi:hypothetical protein